MIVKTVVLLVTCQTVFSRDFESLNNNNWQATVQNNVPNQISNFNWLPAWSNGAQQRQQPSIYFQHSPFRYFSPNPQVFTNFITGHTGFYKTGPMFYYHTLPMGYSQNLKPFVNAQINFNHNNIPSHRGFQAQATFDHQFNSQNVDNNGPINIENLNGKFEDFIKPDPGQQRPVKALTPSNRPQPNQGEAAVHGPTTMPHWMQAQAPMTNHMNQFPSSMPTVHKVPELVTVPSAHDNAMYHLTTASPPVRTTITSSQQENGDNNGDEQYDIDVRKDTD